MAAEIEQFFCRTDNFGVLLHDAESGRTAAIDAPAVGPIKAALARTGWRLTDILVTHSHADHVDGVAPLVAEFGCAVVAPAKARAAVPGADRYVAEGDRVSVGGLEAVVWDAPGHCPDHIVYYFAGPGVAFAGDVLFPMGCGRVFDGAYDAMWGSLSRFMALPDATLVYCGHEYTLANAKFALSVDGGNAALKTRLGEVEALRERGEATAPTTMGQERATNPFLRVGDPAIQAAIGMPGGAPAAVFKELRERKNRF